MSNQLPVSSGGYLKAADFDGEGKTLKVAKPAEYKEENKPGYGDSDGMMYYYYFEDKDGNELQRNSSSKGMAKAWNEAEIEVGDVVQIQAEGAGVERTYKVTKLEDGDVPF